MSKWAPWTTRIFELLANGPQPVEYLIAETRNLVPPGRAYRQAEKTRERIRTNREGVPKVRSLNLPPSTDDATIRVGQRSIVMSTITKMVARGRLEYLEGDDRRFIQIGRPPEKAINPLFAKLNEHQPTFTKRRLPKEDIVGITGRPVDVYDITCSCGWTWSGGRQDPDGDWHVHATSKDTAKQEFTKHRRSFV